MRIHFDVLGWLHICCGAFGVLIGASLWVLASGTNVALANLGGRDAPAGPTVWFLLISGTTFAAAGVLLVIAGRALVCRHRLGRRAALVLAIPNLLVVPFGTALGVYTFWTLLNDQARREFDDPSRAPEVKD